MIFLLSLFISSVGIVCYVTECAVFSSLDCHLQAILIRLKYIE